MRIGTNHFYSLSAAISYYRSQGIDAFDVEYKVNAGEIQIGKPAITKDQRLTLIDFGRRYAIEDRP